MKDISERNRARGVANFWNDRTTMDVVTGSRLRLLYTEPQWTVAVRRCLGTGYIGLSSCTDSSTTCRCNAWHRQHAVFMDPPPTSTTTAVPGPPAYAPTGTMPWIP